MRNQHLHDALKKYCEAAVSFIRANVKSKDDLPLTPVPEFEFTDTGYSATSSMKINWMLLEVMYERALKELPDYKRAVEALEADEVIAKHLNTLSGTIKTLRRIEADDCLRSLLITYINEQEKTEEDAYDRVYERIEDYFYQDVLAYKYLAPLNNFKMEVEKVELEPGFSIIKLPIEERANFLGRLSGIDVLSSSSSYKELGFSKYAFELYHEEPKVIGNRPEFDPNKFADNVVLQNFESACTALRLYKSGNVSYQHVIQESVAWNPLGESIHSPQMSAPFLFGNTYELADEDIPSFVEFWSQFKQAQIRENALRIALTRFTFAYERGRSEDRLIDYVIALEALLLENEPELRFKFALRGAALLGKDDPLERKKVFHELHEGYKQRNNIAHGDIPKQVITIGDETLQLAQLIDRVGNHVRSTIRAFIEFRKNKKQVLEILNQKIVEGFPSEI